MALKKDIEEIIDTLEFISKNGRPNRSNLENKIYKWLGRLNWTFLPLMGISLLMALLYRNINMTYFECFITIFYIFNFIYGVLYIFLAISMVIDIYNVIRQGGRYRLLKHKLAYNIVSVNRLIKFKLHSLKTVKTFLENEIKKKDYVNGVFSWGLVPLSVTVLTALESYGYIQWNDFLSQNIMNFSKPGYWIFMCLVIILMIMIFKISITSDISKYKKYISYLDLVLLEKELDNRNKL
ncbi:hypothetical protein SAMN05660772_02464 [Pasteurella testudinis DSM 23072]|uniref:Uncharacterized protein n=1 Tax=Pasteurella testudinis DSM 23072 TaxID=1122938 RepID=A0A1W1UW08_9PAST|nr:hypothetical protein [Pasteurella testudinis]SMB85273.1 hypothetical protein SAMN05660772_02464 [Pasteurella testudinis DSM 23072]SUB52153.1 Uncharacterised protein [Pasteurella testudinis]